MSDYQDIIKKKISNYNLSRYNFDILILSAFMGVLSVLVTAQAGMAFEVHPYLILLIPIHLASSLVFALYGQFKNLRIFKFAKDFYVLTPVMSTLALCGFAAINSDVSNQYFKLILASESGLLNSFFTLPTTLAIFILSIPFLLFGLCLSVEFSENYKDPLGKVLVPNFVGTTIGLLVGLFSLESMGWRSTFAISVISSSCFFIFKNLRHGFFKKIIISVLFAFFAVWLAPKTEFSPNLNLAARDFKNLYNVSETRRSWTSYSIVQTLEIEYEPQKKFKQIAIGGRGSHSFFPSDVNVPFITVDFAALFDPKEILVIFAGAGHELKRLTEIESNPNKIVGVEMNSKVIKHSHLDSDGYLEKVLQNPRVSLVESEARRFLERNTEKFDVILFSWSGATTAYYSGAIMNTTQYVFTKESLAKSLSSLNKTGKMIIFGGNKMNMIASLKEIGVPNLEKKVLIFEDMNRSDWKSAVGTNVLVLFNEEQSEPTAEFLKRLDLLKEKRNYKLVYGGAQATDPNYKDFEALIESADYEKTLQNIQKTHGLYFSNYDDDKPFVYKTDQLSLKAINPIFSLDVNYISSNRFGISITLLLALFAVWLIYIVIVSMRTENSSTHNQPVFLFLSSTIIGVFSSLTYISFVYKFILYCGNPTLALALSAISSGLAMVLASQLSQKEGSLFQFKVILLSSILGALLISILNLEKVKNFLFEMNIFSTSLVLILFAAVAQIGVVLLFLSLVSSQIFETRIRMLNYFFDSIGTCIGIVVGTLVFEHYGINKVSLFSQGMAILVALVYFKFIKRAYIKASDL